MAELSYVEGDRGNRYLSNVRTDIIMIVVFETFRGK